MTTISTDKFFYSADERVFGADASELPVLADGRQFTLVSAKTGREIVVGPFGIDRDTHEGEVRFWEYRPEGTDVDLFSVRIYND